MRFAKTCRVFVFGILFLFGTPHLASAASGLMGTGKPLFGVYGQPNDPKVVVWWLNEATVGFPAGCSSLILSAATMGMDSYKISVSILITAKVTNSVVKFVAQAEKDGGCGVDYVQLM
jgi:hypothetical protein